MKECGCDYPLPDSSHYSKGSDLVLRVCSSCGCPVVFHKGKWLHFFQGVASKKCEVPVNDCTPRRVSKGERLAINDLWLTGLYPVRVLAEKFGRRYYTILRFI